MEKRKYLQSVTVVRGVAALAVCLFHFTKGFVERDGLGNSFMPYAWLGVEVFFLISGFVIPYSLLGTAYRIKHYGDYIKKRLVRIEPAYIASIIIIILLNFISTQFSIYRGDPFNFSFINILYHLGYLVEFFHGEWLNPVYWTLAVEFHYYLVIGCLLALWNKYIDNKFIIWSSLILFFSLSFINQDAIRFLRHTDIFTLGILIAFYRKKMMNLSVYLILTLIVSICVYSNHNFVIIFLCLFAGLSMAFIDYANHTKVFMFVGKISYSLYLLHVPIGGRIINLAKRFQLDFFSKIIAILLAVAVSILASWLFYKLIEEPSHKWAKKIRERRMKT